MGKHSFWRSVSFYAMFQGPYDDIIIFAFSAKALGIDMYIMNDDFYGWVPQPLEPPSTLYDEQDQFTHIKTENISKCYTRIL